MKRVLVHGALLVLMLIVAFVTWTAGERPETDDTLTAVWDHDADDVTALTYRSRARTIAIERRHVGDVDQLWAVQMDSVQRATPDTVPGDSTAAPGRLEYPVGDEGEDVVAGVAQLRVIRDLGAATAEKRATYGLSDSASVLTLRLRNRAERTLAIGSPVLGGGSVYVQDMRSNRIYVIPIDLLRPLEMGSDMLRLMKVQRFEPEQVATVTVRAGAAQRTMRRRPQLGSPVPQWTALDNERIDEAFGNFMAQVDQLWIARYVPDASADTLQPIIRVDYHASDSDALGYLELFRTRAGSPPTYLMRTGRTIVLGEVYGPLGERLEQDVASLFGSRN
jgi:hypothetical protein